MPASRQRSRSPFIACAVMATMRDVRAGRRARARGWRAVASKPSISGICTSISTRSNALARQRGERLVAVVGDGHAMSALRQQADRDALVDDVVLGEQDAAAGGRPLASTAGATWRRARQPPGVPRRATRHIASSRSDVPDRLGEVRGDAQLAAARRSRP